MVRGLVLLAIISPLLIAAPQMPSLAKMESYDDGWGEDYTTTPDRSTWAAYYAKNARVSFGPEQRLRNGISWRLLVDEVTGIGMPRITWMPDKQRLRRANRLFDTVHGGAMLHAARRKEYLREINQGRREIGHPEIEERYAIVQEVAAVTYATANFISMVDLEYLITEGNSAPRIIRGLTFDLQHESIFKVEACRRITGVRPPGDHAKQEGQFRYGDFLEVCNPGALRRFVTLVQEASDRAVAATANSTNDFVRQCREDKAFISGLGEYAIYLTFKGLAVQMTSYGPNSNSGCALMFNSLNPVIIPYRELMGLMQPGPLFDEITNIW